jgi:hypothetical protein
LIVWAALVAAMPLASLAAAETPWNWIKERNGFTLEKRPVDGSKYYEYRARTHSTVAPPVVVERIWRGIGDERSPTLKRRTVVRRTEDEMVVYDQIRAVVVSDRDVTIRIRRVADARTGAFEIQFESTPELGPPPAAGYVRLTMVRGEWRIEPDRAGGSNIAYRVYSEPGGTIPAFMVRGAQQDSVFDEFERVMARVGR